MSAEPAPRPEAPYNVVYVLPPWAQKSPARRSIAARIGDTVRSDAFRVWLGQVQVLALIGMVASCLYIVLPDLYRLKSEAGIDLVPGVHAPDVFPFLGR